MNKVEVRHNANLIKWTNLIKDCRGSGLSVNEWCRNQGIEKTTYYRWERELLKVATEQATSQQSSKTLAPVHFEEVKMKTEEKVSLIRNSASTQVAVATLRYGAISLDVYPGADVTTLSTIMKAMSLC